MYANYSNSEMGNSVKLLIPAALLLLLSLSGCKKEQVYPVKSRDAVSSYQKTAQNLQPCGTPLVVDLLAGQTMDAGNVTIYNTDDSLYVYVETSGNWLIASTKIYAGTLAGMPQTNSGNPKVGQFPYKSNYSPGVSGSLTAIPLSALPSCYIVAIHVDLQETVNGTVVQTQTGWASGTAMSGNNWGMYVDYCTQDCTPCVYGTQTTTLFAGQSIDVGTVSITNDADSVYVTYSLTGSWYYRQVHIYIGPLSEMPVNSQNVPIPGQFPINEMLSGSGLQTVTYGYPLDNLPECYVIAAHASVYLLGDVGITETQTAWGFGDEFQDTDRWGWTIPYCTQTCN